MKGSRAIFDGQLSLFFHGQEAEPAAKLGKEVGKTKRRMGSKYAFRLHVSSRKHMHSGGLDPAVNRRVLGGESRCDPKNEAANGNV